MDNLSFSVEQLDETKEGESTIGKLKVTTLTRKNVMYSCIIDDFIRCQDNHILTPEACKTFIQDNIKLTKYDYNKEQNVINAVINVVSLCKISFTLTMCKEAIPLTTLIAQLEERLDKLEPYEIIHTFQYPKWDTFEEFTKLPEYQYIVDSYNLDQFVKSIPNKLSNQPNHKVMYNESDKLHYSFNSKYMANILTSLPIKNDDCLRRVTNDIKPYRDTIYERQMSKLYEAANRVTNISIEFNMSSEPCQRYCVHYATMKFINKYMSAWILKHFDLIAGRDPILECIGDTTKGTMTIHIKRLKTKQLLDISPDDDKIIIMPSIEYSSVIIDGVQLICQR